MNKILLIDDDVFICKILKKYLTDNGYQISTAFSVSTALQRLKKENFDLVFCDFRLPDGDGLQMLKKIQRINRQTKVVIITGYADVKIAVTLMKSGASDYITKPLQQEEILLLIKNLSRDVANNKKDALNTKDAFIFGESPKIKNVLKLAETVAPTNMSVLIEGETGSGKEYMARYIHLNSKRKNKPFVAVDCGAIPKDLANSELFGHIKGSFTGAIADKKGVFEQAKGGTLFLDEIGNLSYDVQVKLLRTIQERTINRIGDSKDIHVDVRIIAATNENLKNEVANNNFREDLYHRLNEFEMQIPALRERKEDILLFANYFMNSANRELGKNVKSYDDEAIRIITNYPWYGNLRELKNMVKRIILLADGDVIHTDVFPDEIRNYTIQIENGIEINNVSNDLKEASLEAEKILIIKTLEDLNYNKSKAAQALNIDRKTLYNKLKQFNISLKPTSI